MASVVGVGEDNAGERSRDGMAGSCTTPSRGKIRKALSVEFYAAGVELRRNESIVKKTGIDAGKAELKMALCEIYFTS